MLRALVCSLSLAFASGCLFVEAEGNGVLGKEERDLNGFDRITIDAGLRARLVVGESERQKVVLSGDENLLRFVEMQVEDGLLKIDLAPGGVTTTMPLTVDIEIPYLRSVKANGGSRVSALGVNAVRCEIDVDGGAQVELEGTCDELELDNDGGSKALLAKTSARSADVSANGGSFSELRVTEQVEVTADGGATVRIAGKPSGARNVHVDGGAEVVFD